MQRFFPSFLGPFQSVLYKFFLCIFMHLCICFRWWCIYTRVIYICTRAHMRIKYVCN